jgi:hypothetical protein
MISSKNREKSSDSQLQIRHSPNKGIRQTNQGIIKGANGPRRVNAAVVEKKQALLFFKKAAKTFTYRRPYAFHGHPPGETKVFWFFFSRKSRFLASSHPFHRRPRRRRRGLAHQPAGRHQRRRPGRIRQPHENRHGDPETPYRRPHPSPFVISS